MPAPIHCLTKKGVYKMNLEDKITGRHAAEVAEVDIESGIAGTSIDVYERAEMAAAIAMGDAPLGYESAGMYAANEVAIETGITGAAYK